MAVHACSSKALRSDRGTAGAAFLSKPVQNERRTEKVPTEPTDSRDSSKEWRPVAACGWKAQKARSSRISAARRENQGARLIRTFWAFESLR